MKDLEKPVVVPEAAGDELPVVMRVLVEIRSDGTRTVARAAVKNALVGQEVAVQAEGGTPMALATALLKFMVKVPFLGRPLSKALQGRKLDALR